MVTPYISPASAAAAKAKFARLFATMKLLGDTVDLLLWRDPDMDGIGVQIGPQSVLMILAGRESGNQRSQASVFTGADGEFRKEPPFDVKKGDLFTVGSMHGEITMVTPTIGGVIRAAFVLKA